MTLLEPVARSPRRRPLARLTGYALFHLNLMFSSIEEEQRPEVIQRCYEPLLDLAEQGFRLGIEASGLTLALIDSLAPHWINRLSQLIKAGGVEFVGSGYAQVIGPLMPWRAVAKNLSLGQEVYARLLGVSPTIALVNEQAYAAGLVPLYREAGYRAIVMDWDDAASHHPEWNRSWRYHPQLAVGADGIPIELLWSNTIAFQKLQRFVHGDIALADYTDYIAGQRGPVDRVLAIYANDAECFDFRPGRFSTEETCGEAEWATVSRAFQSLRERGIDLVLPSAALEAATGPNAGNRLRLEASSNPIPVKKQPKYNITRWASSGRDDLWANTMCHRALRAMEYGSALANDADWRRLCRLWSSDFRTHITERRWARFRDDLSAFVTSLEAGRLTPGTSPSSAGPRTLPSVERDQRHIVVETKAVRIAFDTRRGLSIAAMGHANGRALIGGLSLGAIDDIALSPDWYTGNTVFEGPGEPKVTDLERCRPDIEVDPADGSTRLTAKIDTPLGPIEKIIRIAPDTPRVEFELIFHWPHWGKGSLRLGHITLLPDAFDSGALAYRTHNGGRHIETFPLGDSVVDLGAPVSFLISCRSGLGMTEGQLQIDDGKNAVCLEPDLATAATLGLVEHRVVNGQTFCRMMLSALELDETRRVATEPSGPRKVRFAIALSRVNAC